MPCCAFALSAFGFGRCTPSSSSSGLDQSSSGSRPANSTYYHSVDTLRMMHKRKCAPLKSPVLASPRRNLRMSLVLPSERPPLHEQSLLHVTVACLNISSCSHGVCITMLNILAQDEKKNGNNSLSLLSAPLLGLRCGVHRQGRLRAACTQTRVRRDELLEI